MSYIYQGKCSNSNGAILSDMKDCVKALQLDIQIVAEALNTPSKNKGKKGRISPTLTPMTIVHEDALESVGRSKRAGKKAMDTQEIQVDSPAEDKRGKSRKASKKKEEEDEEEEYEVETIIEKREMFGDVQYLVKWKGWEDPTDRTWEPLENLTGSMNLVEIFEKKEEDLKKKAPKRKSDIKFVKENGDTMSEAEDSPKKKSPRAPTKTKKTGNALESLSPAAKSRDQNKIKVLKDDSSDEEKEEEDYEVEKILDMRKAGRNREFLIKWKGWDREEDQTWETEQNLGNSKDLLKEFLAEKARDINSEKSAPRSRKARKSSSSTPEPRISDEPEIVSIEDSDTESNSPPVRARSNKKGKAKKETKKKTAQRKKKEVKKAESDDEEGEEEYEVEKILKKRTVGETVEYQVKWKGWDDEDDLTWEPLDNLASSSQLIKEFESEQFQVEDDVELCEENECQRIFTSKPGLMKHKVEVHGTRERTTKASRKSFENNVSESGRKGTKRGRSPRMNDEDEEPSGKKAAEKVTPPKYKPGPKSRKAALNPWMNRESPDSGGESSSSRTVNRLDMSDSEDEERVTSSRHEPSKTFDDLFGGSNENRETSDQIVFNKDSDDESDGGVANKVNVDALIGGSDNEEEGVYGLEWN